MVNFSRRIIPSHYEKIFPDMYVLSEKENIHATAIIVLRRKHALDLSHNAEIQFFPKDKNFSL